MASATDDVTPQRKVAWVIRDEELDLIPEDSTLDSLSSDLTTTETTTASEMDDDGACVLVTRTTTTKRHLPDDPRLLRLQRKIAKQKEKYKRAQTMAHLLSNIRPSSLNKPPKTESPLRLSLSERPLNVK